MKNLRSIEGAREVGSRTVAARAAGNVMLPFVAAAGGALAPYQRGRHISGAISARPYQRGGGWYAPSAAECSATLPGPTTRPRTMSKILPLTRKCPPAPQAPALTSVAQTLPEPRPGRL